MNTVFARHRTWLILLLGVALIRGLIYMAAIPPWQAPDETGHFEYAWLIAHLGRLPSAQDVSPFFEQELVKSLYEWHYGDFTGRPLPEEMPSRLSDLPPNIWPSVARTILVERFSLAYMWQALFIFPIRSQDLVALLFVARFSSVLLNVGIVVLAFLTLNELFHSRPDLTVLATALITFWPQHTFINSMVGDGTLAEFMSCLTLYFWVRLFRRGTGIWEVVGILIGTGAGIWSKTTALFLIPTDILLATWLLLRRLRKGWKWQYSLYLCAGLVLLGIGGWVWWTHSSLGLYTQLAVQQLGSLSGLTWVDQRGMTLGEGLLASYDSLWANFGWMALSVSERWYGAITLLSVIAIVGWIANRTNKEQSLDNVTIMGGALFFALGIFIGIAFLFRADGYYQFQGRYLFPVAIPFAFFFVGGLARFFSSIWREYGAGPLLFFLIFMDAWCIFVYLLPYFYG